MDANQLQLEVLQQFGELLEGVESQDVFDACIAMVGQKAAYEDAEDMYDRFVSLVMNACKLPASPTHMIRLLHLFHTLAVKVPEVRSIVEEDFLPLITSLRGAIRETKEVQEAFWDLVVEWKKETCFPKLLWQLQREEAAARVSTQVQVWDAPWTQDVTKEAHRATEPVAEQKLRVEAQAVAPFMDVLTYRITRVLRDCPDVRDDITGVLRTTCGLADRVEKAKRLEALTMALDGLHDEAGTNAGKATARFRRAIQDLLPEAAAAAAVGSTSPSPDAAGDDDAEYDPGDDEYDPFAVDEVPEDLVYPSKMNPATTLYLPEPKGRASSRVTAPACGQAHYLCRAWNLPPKDWARAETNIPKCHPIRVFFVRRKKHT